MATVISGHRSSGHVGTPSVAPLLIRHVLLVTIAITCLVPFLWMISTSFKTQADVFTFPPQFVPRPFVLDAYHDLFFVVPMARYALNSAFVATSIMLGQLVFNTLAAYSFAKIPFHGRDVLFIAYLGTMMIPSQVTIVPLFILMKYLGWVDTYYALIMPFILGSAFGTFLIRQYFLTVPRDLEDAARVDGAGHIRILWDVAVPLAKPVMATFAVFSFMYFWNDFMWPLIVTNSEAHKTLTVGLATLSQGYYGTNWPLLMAGTVVSILPILVIFAFAQRYFVQGIALTGLKG